MPQLAYMPAYCLDHYLQTTDRRECNTDLY